MKYEVCKWVRSKQLTLPARYLVYLIVFGARCFEDYRLQYALVGGLGPLSRYIVSYVPTSANLGLGGTSLAIIIHLQMSRCPQKATLYLPGQDPQVAYLSVVCGMYIRSSTSYYMQFSPKIEIKTESGTPAQKWIQPFTTRGQELLGASTEQFLA